MGDHIRSSTLWWIDNYDESKPNPGSRVTWRYMKEYRERKWKNIKEWDDQDMSRRLDSRDARPEQIQDYEKIVVLIGSDMVVLHPNLDVKNWSGMSGRLSNSQEQNGKE